MESLFNQLCSVASFVIIVLANSQVTKGKFEGPEEYKQVAPNNSLGLQRVLRNFTKTLPDSGGFVGSAAGSLGSSDSSSNFGYGYILNKPELCVGKQFLVIFVCSAFHHFEQRKAIRQTWASFKYKNFPPSTGMNKDETVSHANGSDEVLAVIHKLHIVFLVGAPSTKNSSKAEAALLEEDRLFHDMIQGDFLDTYANLTVKSVTMLQWINKYCQDVQYVLKTDDDMFINVPLLVHDLKRTVHKRFIMGDIIVAAQPMRVNTSKWYTPKSVYNNTMYPKYISGAAYVMSGDLVEDLCLAAEKTASFWIEDVYVTGLLAQRINANHIFNGKFRYAQSYFHPCFLKLVIAAHRLDTKTLLAMWTALNYRGLTCDYDLL